MTDLERELCMKIYNAYKERLQWYVRKWLYWLKTEDAHDIQQDTWRKLVEHINEVGEMSPSGQFNWLTTVCHNTAVSFVRKEKKMVSEDRETLERLLEAKKVISLEEEIVDKVLLQEILEKISEDDRKTLYMSEFSSAKRKKNNAETCKTYRVKQKIRKLWKEGDLSE